ncbi:MBL fold metallo-hydrolase [Prosthecobacter sp. SYSU 5D2]|uniref:ComEC/Rec2 family competence protein n=1 Tax=Prosthecobacter sp. SYSU 5D2 TaxID=3134134 RepID=UPI0031FEB2E9
MNIRHFVLLGLLGATSISQPAIAQPVGEVLARHSAGGLDIHHINTGEGSAAFFVFPDGTTMLIDCGHLLDAPRPPKYKSPPLPDDSRPPGEWVSRYIQKYHPKGEEGSLDYVVFSHFHGDHIGGLPELAKQVKIRHVLDRGWPDYQKPTPFTGEEAERYHAALKAQTAEHGTQVHRFKAGVDDQIVLLNEPSLYPEFKIQNLAANGEIWTGSGTEVRQRSAAHEAPNENACSIAMRLTLGRFDYFSGGDLPGIPGGEISNNMPLIKARAKQPEWRDMESPLAWVTGPVDVLLLNHHGGTDTTNAFFLSVLQPRVSIAQTWASRQMPPQVLERLRSEIIYPGPRDIFTTNGMWDGRKEHLIQEFGEETALPHIQNLQNITASQGHIVIRVAPGGDRYAVYVLDDSEESFRIRAVHDGYESR